MKIFKNIIAIIFKSYIPCEDIMAIFNKENKMTTFMLNAIFTVVMK